MGFYVQETAGFQKKPDSIRSHELGIQKGMEGFQILKIFSISKFRSIIEYQLKSGLSSEKIAVGVAIGNFVGILPFLGLHTVMSIGCAYLLRLNPLIVILGSNLSNPLSFPFLLVISAQIGSLALYGRFMSLNFSSDIKVLLSNYFLPVIVGSVILAVVVSFISYFIVLKITRRIRLESSSRISI